MTAAVEITRVARRFASVQALAGVDLKVEQGKRRDAFLAKLRRSTQQTSQKKAAGATKSQ